jgi:enoyl-CoA hydratase/carnithine racemase
LDQNDQDAVLEIKGKYSPAVVTIMLNRPRVKNAIRPQDMVSLSRLLAQYQSDPAVKAIILTGAGDAFCGGADINYLNKLSGTELTTYIDMCADVLTRIISMPKIVIAAVNGASAGFANHISFCADFCVASELAAFHFTGATKGIASMMLGALVAPMTIGLKRSKDLFVRGGRVSAAKAVELGFCNYTVPADRWAEELEKLAAEFAERNATTMAHNKFQLNQGAYAMIGALRMSTLAGSATLSEIVNLPTGKIKTRDI